VLFKLSDLAHFANIESTWPPI